MAYGALGLAVVAVLLLFAQHQWQPTDPLSVTLLRVCIGLTFVALLIILILVVLNALGVSLPWRYDW